jgi:hypothetical protein
MLYVFDKVILLASLADARDIPENAYELGVTSLLNALWTEMGKP